MKNHSFDNLDQKDASVLRDQLKLHCANLRGMIHTAHGQLVDAPALSANDVLADIRSLERHATELKTRLNGTAPAFNPPNSTASVVPTKKPTGKKLTLDEEFAARKAETTTTTTK